MQRRAAVVLDRHLRNGDKHMTLITFQDGKPVMRDGKVGTGQTCCCEGGQCVCHANWYKRVSGWYCNYIENYAWYEDDGVPYDPDEFEAQFNVAKAMIQTSYSQALAVNQKLRENGWCTLVDAFNPDGFPYIEIVTHWQTPDGEHLENTSSWSWNYDPETPPDLSGVVDPGVPEGAPAGTRLTLKLMEAIGFASYNRCCGVTGPLFTDRCDYGGNGLLGCPIEDVREQAIYGPACGTDAPCRFVYQTPQHGGYRISPLWDCSENGSDERGGGEWFYDWKCYPFNPDDPCDCDPCRCVTKDHPALGPYFAPVPYLGAVGDCSHQLCSSNNDFQ